MNAIEQTNDEYYLFLQSKVKGSLQEQLNNIWQQWNGGCSEGHWSAGQLLFSRCYLTDILNQLPAVKEHALFSVLQQGAFSAIEQPPLGESKVAILLCFLRSQDVKKTEEENGAMRFDIGSYRHYFQCGRLLEEEALQLSVYEQTKLLFERHIAFLRKRGMTLADNCMRTWIYVSNIDVNYAAVVKARNDVFEQEGLTSDTHYIASTGIGGQGETRHAAVCIDFYSVDGLQASDIHYLSALDYLNPTHEYGVAFERGTALSFAQRRLFFISGTASIDCHGDCLFRGDVSAQTTRLFLNIEQLLHDGSATLSNIAWMVVYLRDVADYEVIHQYLKQHFPTTPWLITEARVCRPEWLIEVECVATQKVATGIK